MKSRAVAILSRCSRYSNLVCTCAWAAFESAQLPLRLNSQPDCPMKPSRYFTSSSTVGEGSACASSGAASASASTIRFPALRVRMETKYRGGRGAFPPINCNKLYRWRMREKSIALRKSLSAKRYVAVGIGRQKNRHYSTGGPLDEWLFFVMHSLHGIGVSRVLNRRHAMEASDNRPLPHSTTEASSYALTVLTAIVYIIGFATVSAWFPLLVLGQPGHPPASRAVDTSSVAA